MVVVSLCVCDSHVISFVVVLVIVGSRVCFFVCVFCLLCLFLFCFVVVWL